MVIKMVNIKKRGNVYQYQFEIDPVNGTRKYINKSGFKSKREAMEAGIKAYNEYYETGQQCHIMIIWIFGMKIIARLI